MLLTSVQSSKYLHFNFFSLCVALSTNYFNKCYTKLEKEKFAFRGCPLNAGSRTEFVFMKKCSLICKQEFAARSVCSLNRRFSGPLNHFNFMSADGNCRVSPEETRFILFCFVLFYLFILVKRISRALSFDWQQSRYENFKKQNIKEKSCQPNWFLVVK